MFRVYKNGTEVDSKVVEYIADTIEDVDDLPTNIGSGSTCIVIQGPDGGAAVFMLGNDSEWHQI